MEWLDFGKYNFYIWTSYTIVFVVLLLNVLLPLLTHRDQLQKIKRRTISRGAK